MFDFKENKMRANKIINDAREKAIYAEIAQLHNSMTMKLFELKKNGFLIDESILKTMLIIDCKFAIEEVEEFKPVIKRVKQLLIK